MRRALVALAGFMAAGGVRPAATQAPIADNSFLIEEAYNQEPGVVQHISALLRPWDGATWAYSFTQEWPLFGQRSQLSFTVPVEHGPVGTALGDVLLNYRYQIPGLPASAAAAPRLSALLPTGDDGRGGGAAGVQVNVPVSVALGRHWVTHWNAGATAVRRSPSTYHLAASTIWLARPSFNVVLEIAWERAAGAEELVVNPGIRWAHNVGRGLQIVPGIAFPLGIGPSRGEDGLFLYLSFEHPFR